MSDLEIEKCKAAAEFSFINPRTDNYAIAAAFTRLILAFGPQLDGTVITQSLISVPDCILANDFKFRRIIPTTCSNVSNLSSS